MTRGQDRPRNIAELQGSCGQSYKLSFSKAFPPARIHRDALYEYHQNSVRKQALTTIDPVPGGKS